jgi:hypothetical protein
MIQVSKILSIQPFEITCLLSNGVIKKLNVLPLIENHLHLDGVEKLKESSVFLSASIGAMGEICWKDIVKSKDGLTTMDYDISPEFLMHNGITLNTGLSNFASI